MLTMRSTWTLGTLCVALAVATAGLTWRTVELGAKVTALSAAAAAKAVGHRRELAKAERDRRAAEARHRNELAKMRAKARLRRLVVAVPIVGTGAAGYFEWREYLEWKEEHPGGTFDDYATEVGSASAEVADEVLQELPDGWRPDADVVSAALEASLLALRHNSEEAGP